MTSQRHSFYMLLTEALTSNGYNFHGKYSLNAFRETDETERVQI